MTIEELEAQLLDLQGKYDNLNETVKQKDELLEGFKAKEVEHAAKVTEYQDQIMRLRDMNTEMFLKISQPIPQPQDPIKDEPKLPQEETITLDEILG